VLDNYTLNITASGGTVIKSPDQATYQYGTQVQLTAVPDSGYHFRDWIGDASGTANPINVTMDRARDITARFQTNTFTISTVFVGGSATIEKFPDQPRYNPGSKVDIFATPSAGFQFVRWTFNAADTIPVNPASFTTDSSLTLYCHLVAGGPPVLNTQVVGQGSVSKTPNQPSYPPGTTVTVTATPAAGWRFDHWSGVHHTVGNPLQIFMDQDKTVTAHFEPTTFTLTVNTLGTGSVVKNPNQASYDPGTVVNATATASGGMHFMGWGGDTTAATNPLPVPMNRNRSITAMFGWAVIANVTGGGSVARTPNQSYVLPGDSITLVANPDPGWAFIQWTGGVASANRTIRVVPTSDVTVTAVFQQIRYQLSLQTEGNGSIVADPSQTDYLAGSQVMLAAVPSTGWRFVGWSEGEGDVIVPPGRSGGGCPDCLTGSANPATITMYGSRTIIATFEPDLPLLVTTQGEGTVVTQRNDDAAGPRVHLTAVPKEGWVFAGWSGDATSVESAIDLQVLSARSVTARFTPVSPLAEPLASGQPAVTEFAITKITPNPTTGPTRLEFTVPRDARVLITVLDAQGREVARLVDGRFAPGRHQTLWDGAVKRGERAPGLYFLRMRAGDLDIVRRLVVTR
jgi:hypothetical protein